MTLEEWMDKNATLTGLIVLVGLIAALSIVGWLE